jgi:DNA-directed RNA polymerase III subunit RPC6
MSHLLLNKNIIHYDFKIENTITLIFYWQVQLSVEDMETILDTLLYDGKVERSVATDGSHLYRAVESLLPAPGIVRIPCGVCPVSILSPLLCFT